MATQKLNIDLTKPISVESQMALVEYARQHRTQMCDAIAEWLNERLPYANGDDEMEWWFEDDAHTMKGILYAADEDRAWSMYCMMETAVRDSLIDLASGVYESEQESDEPVLKTYTVYYKLNGMIDIVAESEEAAQDLFYSQELEQKVWDDVLTNELVIMGVDVVTA